MAYRGPYGVSGGQPLATKGELAGAGTYQGGLAGRVTLLHGRCGAPKIGEGGGGGRGEGGEGGVDVAVLAKKADPISFRNNSFQN